MPDHANGFACWMASATGRGLRIVVGLALIAWGWTMRGTPTGTVLMIVGLIPLGAGVFNVCLIALIIGAPFSGARACATRDARTP